ncbi:sensor histidine kinase [Thermosulfuriphilus sp.]
MDISEANAGLLTLKREPLLLEEVIQELAQLFQALARTKGIDFKVSYPPQRIILFGDRRKILQALLNILDNAFRVTPHGGRIEITLKKGREIAEIEVSDTGPGIPEGEIPKIFKRFYRRNPSGRGIGLALTKAYIEAHGGQIKVSSRLGIGTVFSISLPLYRQVAKSSASN